MCIRLSLRHRQRRSIRCYLYSLAYAHQSIDYDPIFWLKSFVHYAQPIDGWTQFYGAVFHGVLTIDDENKFLA